MMRHLGLLVFLAFLTSCGSEYRFLGFEKKNEALEDVQDGDIQSELYICSDLDFSHLKNTAQMNKNWINAYAIALNISGSFEGEEFWKNITNNFDGQGLSLGLLNQTLGTESLQPLLSEMQSSHSEVLKRELGDEYFDSLEKMIFSWKKNKISGLKMELLFSDEMGALSHLDEKNLNSNDMSFQSVNTSTQASVQWALENLYVDSKGLKFKKEWKEKLQRLCTTKEYKQIQYEAAIKIHDKAYGYWKYFSFKQLKSYLFLFDIVVQNGGFYSKNLLEYNDFIEKNPQLNEKQKIKKILEIRLKQVKSEFKEDVFKRKNSIIEGYGDVHGESRKYDEEYCFDYNLILGDFN